MRALKLYFGYGMCLIVLFCDGFYRLVNVRQALSEDQFKQLDEQTFKQARVDDRGSIVGPMDCGWTLM